jgi:cation:H+ antiporter
MVVGGIAGIIIGAKMTVDSAIIVARIFGMSDAFIALSVVALGTSLPELAATAVAAYKKKVDIAVGTIVGSNIFNIFFVLGLTSVIHPIKFSLGLLPDLIMAFVAALLLFIGLFIGERHKLKRWEGGVFVGMYILYIIFITIRG